MIQTHKQISDRWSINKVFITIFFPILGLFQSLINWRKHWAMNIFWLASIYMGTIHIFHPAGTILGEGADGGRYVLDLIHIHNNVHSFSEISKYFYNGGSIDVYQQTLTYIISRFSDNGHVLFLLFSAVFGFFYSRNIWYILEKLPNRLPKGFWVLILLYFFVCPIWLINGVRMWTATHVFVYGAMPYLIENKKNKLIWCFASILFHHSFIFPIILLGIFVIVFKYIQKGNLQITGLFVFYLFSLTVNTLDLGAFSTFLQSILPSFYDDRIMGYINENALQRNMESASLNSWHVVFFNDLQYWIVQLLIIFTFFTIKRNRASSEWLISLFAFSLLIYSFSNILACVPSGGRYITIARMFMTPLILLIISYLPLGSIYKNVLPLLLLFLGFSLIFDIRKGMEFYGISLLFGNYFTAPLFNDNYPIIDYIKQI